ncbi:MAG: 3-oxoacyl-[acyl-carrier-protein] reductase [Oscillospiraceae bacterium]|nr:3-oxoacyl-[acyl-carrier-protein] reductase [Oscillospiraceae bacterium]
MSKVALITGGSRGIGKAVAIKFAKEGYDIVINYRSESDNLKELKNELSKYNVKVMCISGDVTAFDRWGEIAKEVIEKFGSIDVLVNNAGITKDTLLLRMSEKDFSDVIDINLKGTFNVTKQVIPYMTKQRRGRIVNISSIIGIIGNAGQANYAASKAGIIAFTKSCAKEFASRNILINAVAPGFIKTDMTAVLSDAIRENINNQIPLKREGTVEEVANLVYFLGAEENTYITGQVINVDGGMVC